MRAFVADSEAARSAFLRSQDIVAELMGGLNMEAGEIASNLFRLYEYLHRRLVEANVHRDIAAANEVETLVKSLIELHGGRVEVHSDGPGKGCEFVVRLPAPAAIAQEPRASDRDAECAGVQRRRVLIVDRLLSALPGQR